MHHDETSRDWRPFAAGMAVGVAAGLLGVGVAVMAERATRRTAARSGTARQSAPPVVYPAAPAGTRQLERELDEELAQTFPASDPLPYSHQVD